jgi:hypothetical protein
MKKKWLGLTGGAFVGAGILAVLLTGTFSSHVKAENGPSMQSCFYKSEETSNMNKICYYDCMGSKAAITIAFTAICPQTLSR